MKTPNQSYNLVHALREVAARNNKRQADVARATDFNHVFVSRVFNGTQPNLSSTELEKICDVICKNDEDRAIILRAFLLDKLGEVKGSNLIQIAIAGEEGFARSTQTGKPLDPKFRESLAKLAAFGIKYIDIAKVVNQSVQTLERVERE